jgi:hypothetical protein
MATDGPTPPPCDKRIFEEGVCVLITHSIPSCAMEGWVKKVAAESGQPVDWHFAGGRAVVLALGDTDRVRAAMEKLRPEHDALYRKAVDSIMGGAYGDMKPPWWH